MKPEDVDEILHKFNSFHKNLEFTVDRFDDCIPHFLDLEIHPDGLSIYRKETHTAQFVHYDSFIKWNNKVAWIRSLTSRVIRLCSANKLNEELATIKRFASYNGFPRWITNKLVRESTHPHPRRVNDDEDTHDIYMFLPYAGKEAESIVLRCKKRLYRLFRKDLKIKFRVHLQSKKLSFLTSNKDRTPMLSSSCVVYHYECPGCMKSYIGKTESTLFNRTKEHGWSDKKSAVFKHFGQCSAWKEIVDLFQTGGEEVDSMQFQINSVRENTKIIRKADNWLKLAFLESLAIKEYKPELNKGIRSCKELALF